MIDIDDPELYRDWSEEELAKHVKKLQTILALKQGKRQLPTKDDILKMADPDGNNFLGTGMTLQDFLAAYRLLDVQSNLLFQDLEERRRRVGLIIELGAALVEIRKQTLFAVGLAEGVIEDVVRGDWRMLREHAKMFRFEHESEDLRKTYGPIYAAFAAVCQKAFDTRPGASEVLPALKN